MDQIKSIALLNKGAYVARIEVKWQHPVTGQKGTYADGHDICVTEERTVVLTQTNIPEGAHVYLHVDVVAGRDLEADEVFEFSANANKTAKYRCTGTTLFDHLYFDGLV
ncbi:MULTISPECIES: hypothetical protein [unclassified Fibrobacter]|uniref:hypothetical protein n=1 Tax=unclassified Fibrobacter TaxID=2634177 RepID=UPI0009176DE2|nr:MULTISPECIES: hypothetical protein [unclassified Fibrobacter]SHK71090.1 hypothetical protein SAMN05720759_105267 [Fibrobacter sp. UWB12]SIO00757.1 hypothetical protein SAMN05720758_0989 [Fibrobacter sp. UWB11]